MCDIIYNTLNLKLFKKGFPHIVNMWKTFLLLFIVFHILTVCGKLLHMWKTFYSIWEKIKKFSTIQHFLCGKLILMWKTFGYFAQKPSSCGKLLIYFAQKFSTCGKVFNMWKTFAKRHASAPTVPPTFNCKNLAEFLDKKVHISGVR